MKKLCACRIKANPAKQRAFNHKPIRIFDRKIRGAE